MDDLQKGGHAKDATVAAALLKGGDLLLCTSRITICIDHFLTT